MGKDGRPVKRGQMPGWNERIMLHNAKRTRIDVIGDMPLVLDSEYDIGPRRVFADRAQDVTQFAKVAILARHVIAGVFPAAFREG